MGAWEDGCLLFFNGTIKTVLHLHLNRWIDHANPAAPTDDPLSKTPPLAQPFQFFKKMKENSRSLPSPQQKKRKKNPPHSSPQPTPPSKSMLSPLRPPNTKPFLGANQYRNHSLPFNHCFFPSLTPFMVPLKVLAGQRRRPVTEETLAH